MEELASALVGVLEGFIVSPSFIGVRRIKAITTPVTMRGRATYLRILRAPLDVLFVIGCLLPFYVRRTRAILPSRRNSF
jgi:hypothetical protein